MGKENKFFGGEAISSIIDIPPMTEAEAKVLNQEVRNGALVGAGAGILLSYIGKRSTGVYVLLGLIGALIGGAIPVYNKARKKEVKKEQKKESNIKVRQPVPAPSLAMNEQMIVDGVDDFRDNR